MQRLNLEKGPFFTEKFPIREQFLTMNLYPNPHHRFIISIHFAGKLRPGLNIKRRLFPGMPSMKMRFVMRSTIFFVHSDDDSVKHCQCSHRFNLSAFCRLRQIVYQIFSHRGVVNFSTSRISDRIMFEIRSVEATEGGQFNINYFPFFLKNSIRCLRTLSKNESALDGALGDRPLPAFGLKVFGVNDFGFAGLFAARVLSSRTS